MTTSTEGQGNIALTIDDLRKVLEEFPPPPHERLGAWLGPFTRTLYGLRIIEVHEEPVLRLADHVQVGLGFRLEFNSWLLAMFGTRNILPRNQLFVSQAYGLAIMRPSDAALLRTIIP